MSTAKTGKLGSRVTQRKKLALQACPGEPKILTISDFDPTLNYHQNGREVDPVEGREVRLPHVIAGMRENKSCRDLAQELTVHFTTIASDKKFILEEAWELRQEFVALWLEEQLQHYEYLHSLVMKPMIERDEDQDKASQDPPNLALVREATNLLDKITELKGLKRSPTFVAVHAQDNSQVNLNADAAAAAELLAYLKAAGTADGRENPS